MRERYIAKTFQAHTQALIVHCDKIVSDYAEQGYKLTVRQIYYQLVAQALIENSVKSYANIQGLINNARLAGLIDWDAIEDRTREINERSHWRTGSEILESSATFYHQDMWATQTKRVFVIVEKEALAGVLERVCQEWDLPLLAARGYPSATTLRELAKTRIMGARQEIVVLHLGDHDPSGIDMSRDLLERLRLFSRERAEIDFRRIALNMDQVDAQALPANPAKTTDGRYESYRARYGEESWELDALSPRFIHNLVQDEVKGMIDWPEWNDTQAEIDHTKDKLRLLADNFDTEE